MGGIAMHNSTVQAYSLSQVQSVADSPPVKPSLRRALGSQLTLYIARVPGSKDIFLTTLKPKDKVVSAQDVESSLYYCHLEADTDNDLLKEDLELLDDEEVAAATDSAIEPSSPEDELSGQLLHPPPVPPHSEMRVSAGSAPVLPPRPVRSSVEVKRKPVGTNGCHEINSSAELPPPVPVRPLGPRSFREKGDNDHHLSTSLQGVSLDKGDEPPETPPRLPRRPISTQSSNATGSSYFHPTATQAGRSGSQPRPQTSHSKTPRSPHSFDASWSGSMQMPRPSLSPRSTSSSITRTNSLNSVIRNNSKDTIAGQGFNVILIRRDPTTGSQSNIGKITIPPVSPRYGRPGKALLQIFNQGYEKFRAARGTTTADLVRCISEDDYCTYSSDLRLATRRRSMKSPSTPYFGDVPVNQLIAVTPSQPYAFVSPWNRVCEFSTGMSGRSLKCRHMLARGTLYDENPNDMSVVSLSELRFNTPSTSVFSKVSPRRARHTHSSSGASATSLRRKPSRVLFGGPDRLSQDGSSRSTLDGGSFLDARSSSVVSSEAAEEMDEDDDDWDIEPMDLALGQEKPGGGFKGNKAKLGKLIIEPEGLEMLDLLVAANMGVWWSIR